MKLTDTNVRSEVAGCVAVMRQRIADASTGPAGVGSAIVLTADEAERILSALLAGLTPDR